MIDFHPCCHQEIAKSNTRLGPDLAPGSYSALGRKMCINISAVLRPAAARLEACCSANDNVQENKHDLLSNNGKSCGRFMLAKLRKQVSKRKRGRSNPVQELRGRSYEAKENETKLICCMISRMGSQFCI